GDSTVLRGEARSDGTSTALSIAGETVTAPRRINGEASPVMLLRPEKLAIRRPGHNGANGANRLPGTIAEAIYLGSGSKYEVRLADGSTASAR
ncbi:MAG: TOBE domain-containing protein, partial [Mesorhizobium sp.]